MAVKLQIDGGEQYLPYAKQRLAVLEEQLLRQGLRTGTRRYKLDDAEIEVHVSMPVGGAAQNRIRIAAGKCGFFYVDAGIDGAQQTPKRFPARLHPTGENTGPAADASQHDYAGPDGEWRSKSGCYVSWDGRHVFFKGRVIAAWPGYSLGAVSSSKIIYATIGAEETATPDRRNFVLALIRTERGSLDPDYFVSELAVYRTELVTGERASHARTSLVAGAPTFSEQVYSADVATMFDPGIHQIVSHLHTVMLISANKDGTRFQYCRFAVESDRIRLRELLPALGLFEELDLTVIKNVPPVEGGLGTADRLAFNPHRLSGGLPLLCELTLSPDLTSATETIVAVNQVSVTSTLSTGAADRSGSRYEAAGRLRVSRMESFVV